ncbi:Uncharacterised protein [Tatumella ptyseos]|uniref:Uncharacterized protein n=1 Tax=Tatumella ptyseos TaxID=82987 RepID=A0A2X5R1E1_9GAMM|nr:Uncharacterised protein [Tatumella ptyseos]
MNDGINRITGLSYEGEKISGNTENRPGLRTAFSQHRCQDQQGKKDNVVGTV